MTTVASWDKNRERMVEEQLIPRGILDDATLQAMRTVPRHLFVDDAMASCAYGDHPLPIGAGQTISQPYIVALMTQSLQLKPTDRVLEIGTGSGYQAAVLSRICERVYTIERIDSLLVRARKIFDKLHYHNITSKLDDGTEGWPSEAPFEAIIVTAGGPNIPEPLIKQLTDPGKMIIPVGDQFTQQLQLVEKIEGKINVRTIEFVRFVNLVGSHGWPN